MRMPLVVSYPSRVAPGQVRSAMVTNVDMAQTLLDAAGVSGVDRDTFGVERDPGVARRAHNSGAAVRARQSPHDGVLPSAASHHEDGR